MKKKMKQVKLEYSSNNSGGGWWLSDKDWQAMKKAGWNVDFKTEKWLGAIATNASIQTNDVAKTIREWENITGQNAADEGCNCCGQPHNFSWVDEDGKYHSLSIDKETSWSLD